MKKVLVVSLVLVMSLSLVACGNSDDPLSKYSKQDLIRYAHSIESDVDKLNDMVDDLNQKLVGVYGEDERLAAITEFSDGTGRKTLHSVDGKVELPATFSYPNSHQGYSTALIQLGNGMTIRPSSNWEVQLNGSEITLHHAVEDINGLIVVGGIDTSKELVKAEELKDVIAKFFEEMPPVTVSYSRIYYDTNWCGEDAKASTFIDEDEAQIRCGMLRYGELSIIYMFEYKGTQNSSKDELVLNTLQSLSVSGVNIKFEA